MKIYYDKYHQPERPTVYLGTPNHKIVCALNGIDDDSFSLKANLNNTYELSFDVAKFITINGVEIESNAYRLIDMLMRVYVTGIGWFLLEAPKINNDGKKETKSITAQSAEIEMQQHDIRNLKIGQGTTDSYEMLIKKNVHIDDDGVERAIEKIKFYNPDNPELSLLDILMKVSGLKDWSIGYIDPTPKIYKYYVEGELKDKQVPLSDEEGAFDIGTQDLYSFLTQDAAQLYSCVFVFDFNKLTINAYRPENLGKDTNINIGFRNLQQSNDISVDEKNIFTRYQVSGSDDLGIQYVNFGSNIIENLDYYLTEKYLSPDVITKYKLWQDDVEIQRPLYIEQTRLYNEQMNIISELKNRVPLDDCSTDWSTFSDEKLLEAQANYQAQLKGYEDFYVDENGNFDKAALDASSDAKDYYQIKDVILPSIQIEIDNRNLPTKEGEADYIDSYKTDWKLYGLDELEVKLSVYNKRKKVLENYEYGGEYKPEKHTRDIYDKLHQEYIDATNQLNSLFTGSCQEAYIHRKTEVENAIALRDQYDSERKSIGESIEKSTWVHDDYHFSESDLSELSKLYIDNDYTNDYMLLTDSDDAVSAIDEQLKLLSAAQDDLYIASQPQYIYSTSLDNFLAKYEYKNYTDNLNLGDFLYLGVRDDYVVKLRTISASYNPMKMDNNLQIEFSNMIRSRADRNDFSYMLNSTSGRGKSSSSGSSHGFLGNEGVTLTAGLIQKLLQAGAFSNKVGQIINNEFAGYIGSFISVKNLNAEMIKATDIVGENGFFEYLQSKLISSDKIISGSGIFRQLDTLVASIKNAIIGTSSTETGIIIKLTADNAVIDEAFIKWLIARYISVNELKAGNIDTNKINVLSEDGSLSIIGNTQTFRDKDGNIRIQIGEDAKGDFTFVLYNEGGTGVLMDSTGIKESAIADGLIKNDMIADKTIGKEKVNWESAGANTDENGNPVWNAAQITIDNEGVDVKFSSILNELQIISQKTEALSRLVNSIDLYGEQIFTETNGVITPGFITIFAKCNGDTKVDKWFLDDVENSEYVSQDKSQLMIPNEYMKDKKLILIKAQNSSGTIFDLFSVYKIADNSAADSYTIILTNESLMFSVDSAGYPTTDQSYTSRVVVYRGTEKITGFTIENIQSLNGIGVQTKDNSITFSADPTTMITDSNGEFTVEVDIDGGVFERTISWTAFAVNSDIFTGNFTSSEGTVFDKSKLEADEQTTLLTAHVYCRNREIDSDLYWVKWYQQKDNGSLEQFSAEKTVVMDLNDFETSNDIYFDFDFYDTYPLTTDDGFVLTTDSGIPLVIINERM